MLTEQPMLSSTATEWAVSLADFARRHREIASYVVAGAAYIALGFIAKQVFAWWSYGAAFAVLTIWGLPALARRWRR